MQNTQNEIKEIVAAVMAEIADQGIEFPDEEIRQAVRPELNKLRDEIRKLAKPARVTVNVPKGADIIAKDVGLQHARFADLLRLASVRGANGHRLNVWLAGPAGTGKTTAAENVAKALGLKFYFNGAIDSEHKLLGFTNAQGKIVSRPFREAYEKGGVYLFDEVDGSLPAALLAFNAALANGHCDFPDGAAKRHPDCIIIAAANTYGSGATPEYVGRMKQDAAMLDRFVFLDWPVDESLETAIADGLGQREWARDVQTWRARAQAHGLRVVISPRATYHGAAMLAAGLPRPFVLASCVTKGLPKEHADKLGLN